MLLKDKIGSVSVALLHELDDLLGVDKGGLEIHG